MPGLPNLPMQTNDDILSLLRAESVEAARKAQRGVILQPGALGDSILTLPLAAFMKDVLGLGGVDMFGHTEYIGIFPGRTCVESVSSIDSIDLHRLFVEPKSFELADRDPLISAFSGYAWITTFLGEPGSDFEQNLIFTANCSHSSEVVTLPAKPPEDFSRHVTEFHRDHLIRQTGVSSAKAQPAAASITASAADVRRGRYLLEEADVEAQEALVVIHPGSGGQTKCWHLENFIGVADALRSKGVAVVYLLGPAELDRFGDAVLRRITEAGTCMTDLPLADVLSVLACAGAFLGNDSGIVHLAAGLGVHTFVVFGPTKPTIYRPIGPAVTVFASDSSNFTTRTSPKLQQEVAEAVLGCVG